MQLSSDKSIFKNQIQIKKVQENARLADVTNQTSNIQAEFNREISKKQKEQEMQNMEQELKIQTKHYKGNVLQSMLLDSIDAVYQKLYIKNLSVTNISGMDGTDEKSTGLATAVAGFNAMNKVM